MCVWSYRFPGISQGYLKSTVDTSIPSFLFKFFGHPFVYLNFYYHFRQFLCLIIATCIFKKMYWGNSCSHWASSESGHIDKPSECRPSRELSGRLNNDNFLRIELFLELLISSAHSSCWEIAGFQSYCDWEALGFRGDHEAGSRQMGIRCVKVSESLLFLLSFCHFSWINVPLIVLKLLLISGVLKSWFWQLF